MLVISNKVNRKVKAAFAGAAAVLVTGLAAAAADVLPDQPLLLALVAAVVPPVVAYLTKASQDDVTDVKPDVDTKDNTPFDLGD